MPGNKGNYHSAMKQGHHLAKLGRWSEAARAYRVAAKEFPADVDARNCLAVALEKSGSLAESLQEYVWLSKQLPNDRLVQAKLADIRQYLHQDSAPTGGHLRVANKQLDERHREEPVAIRREVPEVFPARPQVQQPTKNAFEETAPDAITIDVATSRAVEAGSVANGPVADGAAAESSTEIHPVETAALAADFDDAPTPEKICSLLEGLSRNDRVAASVASRTAESLLQRYELVELDDLISLPSPDRRAALQGMVCSADYLRLGLTGAASDVCLSLTERLPSFLPIQARLAQVYLAQGLEQDAVDKYETLFKLYQLRDWPDRAIDMLRRMLSVRPGDLAGHRILVSLLLEQRSIDDAARELGVLARILAEAGDVEKALEVADEILTVAPDSVSAHLDYAFQVEQLGRHDRAVAAHQKILALDPGNTVSQTSLLLDSVLSGRWADAESMIDRLLEVLADHPQEQETVVESLAISTQTHPGNGALRLALGSILHALGRHVDAAEHLLYAVQGCPEVAAPAAYLLSKAALERGDTEAALAQLQESLRQLPEVSLDSHLRATKTRILKLLAEAYSVKGMQNDALRVLVDLKELVPEERELRLRIAQLHFARGEQRIGISELSELAALYAREGDAERSSTLCEVILARDPQNPAAIARLAEVHVAHGLVEEAARELEELVKIHLAAGRRSDAVAALRRLAELFRHSKWPQSLECWQRLARLVPDDLATRQALIMAYLQVGRPSEAKSEALRAAQEFRDRGPREDAILAVRQVMRLDPWNAWAHECLRGLLGSDVGN